MFGLGAIYDMLTLATRAALRIPYAPGDDGVAGAFKNQGAANTAVGAAVTSDIVANWMTRRVEIAKGSAIAAVSASLTGSEVALQKTDTPYNTPYNNNDLPKYRGGQGYRPLYPGEREWEVLSVSDLEEEIWSTPAIAKNQIFVRTQEAIYCFEDIAED